MMIRHYSKLQQRLQAVSISIHTVIVIVLPRNEMSISMKPSKSPSIVVRWEL
jgi:hypothetical protein